MPNKLGGKNNFELQISGGLLECLRYVTAVPVAVNLNGFRDEIMRYPFNQIIVRAHIMCTDIGTKTPSFLLLFTYNS